MWWLLLSPLRFLISGSILIFFLLVPFYRVQLDDRPGKIDFYRKIIRLVVFLLMCIPLHEPDCWHNTIFNSALLQFVDWIVRMKKMVPEGVVVFIFILYKAQLHFPYHTMICLLCALFYCLMTIRDTTILSRLYAIDRNDIKSYVVTGLSKLLFTVMGQGNTV